MRRAPTVLGLVFAAVIISSSGGGGPPRALGAGEPTAGPKATPKAVPRAKPAPSAAASAEVTLQGDLTCAKCGLHESSTCQSVLVVKQGSGKPGGQQGSKNDSQGTKDVKYYLARNAVADAQHEKVCGGSVPVTITGVVTEEGGRKVLTASTVIPQ